MDWPILLAIAALVLLIAASVYGSRKRGGGGIGTAAAGAGEPPMWMRVVITLVFTVASLYVILTPEFPEAEKKWAFGVAGIVLGYWLG